MFANRMPNWLNPAALRGFKSTGSARCRAPESYSALTGHGEIKRKAPEGGRQSFFKIIGLSSEIVDRLDE
jgi:hypothetical protein